MELTFDQERGASEVDALLSEAASDGNIGGIEVGEIKSDGVIEGQLLLHKNYIVTSLMELEMVLNL